MSASRVSFYEKPARKSAGFFVSSKERRHVQRRGQALYLGLLSSVFWDTERLGKKSKLDSRCIVREGSAL